MYAPDTTDQPLRCGVFSVVKHAYVPRGVASHPRFDLVVVADDAQVPEWAHERNRSFAREYDIPYVRDIEKAISDYELQVAVVSSEAERHIDLSCRAAEMGLHVVQDKPMSTSLEECDRLVEVVHRKDVRFMMWNRNFLPSVIEARRSIQEGVIGKPYAIHVDFYFAKDSGPPKGSRSESDPPINWLERQIEAHADGSDGGVGSKPMGELEIEGIYPLAYIHTLLEKKVRRVFACTTSHFHQVNEDNNVEDLATVTLEMDDALVGTLCIGRIGAASHPDIGEIKIHVLGTEGALVVSEARPEVSIFYRNQPPFEFRNRRIAVDNDYWIMEDMVKAIDEKRSTLLDAQVSRDICATVQASVHSGQCGRVVSVPK
ncbi:MAG: Gfo/Idh/MocA family oxidoreductase [Planctomycetota bacterium]|nr:Gfo/Idh/MocA family oxidoreductase [Planctomycetota bacterium]